MCLPAFQKRGDGVPYSLWGVLYELDGMGDNVCVPNPDSVNAALEGLGEG